MPAIGTVTIVADVIGTLKSVLLGAAHEFIILRLRLRAWLDTIGRPQRRPRVMTTACWTFPVYSQTFVHQEVQALARAGFMVLFLYARLAPRTDLAPSCESLWSLKQRIILHRRTGARDLARFRRRQPAQVEALVQALVQATGLTREVLEQNEHFLQAFSFARAVQAWKADYLHSYFFYEQTLFAWVASRLLGIPRGVSCYADHMLDDYGLKAVRLHLQDCAVVVATSRRIAEELEQLHRAPLPTLVVKPNAIDTAEFLTGERLPRQADKPLRILSVCRIDPKKGIEFLVEAVRLLLDNGLAVDARIIGAADANSPVARAYALNLRSQATELDIDQAVTFLGQRGSRDIHRELAEADIFVAPFVDLPNGDKDGIPTAILEAMASGCAIIATDAGSIVEVIEDGVHGLIVPQRDAAALAFAVQALARHDGLRSQLGTNAIARVQRDYDVHTSEFDFHRRIRGAILKHRDTLGHLANRP
ncbi:glycosyltransferase family 4 protein [Thermomonas carbonis]|uniref:Glycosyltransferase family 4 protein n=1 Tax=Thermomonas carbonis TaxID=1463158 RepID=A0A7G9SMR4_9GAMM|nr:glycosyltransferase family 4 protein [Thermomonas carbonis]QNN69139.1 glycosyltransferase family 4 protein [Thermomonas carbonis]GHC06503.1 colanic acid biosynthesis glycosyltransferase WcaL [Thermomonas carbonis]